MKRFDYWIKFPHYIPSQRASITLFLLEQFVNQALLQFDRVHSNLKKQNPNLLNTIFSDCHFLFISLNKVSELIYQLYKITGFPEIAELLKENKKFFQEYNMIRNHYEHIEERTSLMKREFEPQRNFLNDFGNIENYTYSFGGDKYDISHNSRDILITIYQQIYEIIEHHINHQPR